MNLIQEAKNQIKEIASKAYEKASEKGINVSCLGQYCFDNRNCKEHTLIINYSGIEQKRMKEAVERLFEAVL